MDYNMIVCPYCFGEFHHTEVHFRADNVNPSSQCPAIPPEYDDIEHFKATYEGKDKEYILQEARRWEYFQAHQDEKYENFWKNFGGTTEYNPTDDKLGVVSYLRPVIDPGNRGDQQFLELQADGDYLIYDPDGFTEGIRAIGGNATTRRVCPHCHNPLPLGYGKNPISFVSIIGITASGKTVYLSQLLRNLDQLAEKVGQAVKTQKETNNFLAKNPVKANVPLPGSTPPISFQQPMFFNLTQFDGIQKTTNTFVLYDIAGEDCVDPDLVEKFGRFIAHSDGIFLLIDPMQFSTIKGLKEGSHDEASEPDLVLDGIHDIIMGRSKADERCNIPVAVCISKSDMPQVHNILDPSLNNLLNQPIEGKKDRIGHSLPLFNSDQYNPVGEGLRKFVMDNEAALEHKLYSSYSRYNYFAFSSLGCPVEKGDAGDVPVGPIIPSRIEEPLLWLWHMLGYIDADPPAVRCGLPSALFCSECGTIGNPLSPDERQRVIKTGFLKKTTIIDTYECPNCGNRW